jgi:protein TonB
MDCHNGKYGFILVEVTPAEPTSIVNANPAPPTADEVVMEVRREGRAIPLTVQYVAIREIREFVAAVPGANCGMLFGTYSADAIVIDHAASAPCAQRPIGFFRVQSGGWPAITEADRQKMRDLRPTGGLLLVIRTLAQRPWPATLYAVDCLRLDSPDAPLAEFPFDEYLLRNGWLTDLTPPVPPVQPAPPKRLGRWASIGLAVTVLLLGGAAAAYRWLPLPARSGTASTDRDTADAAIPDAAPLALKLSPTAGNLELSWNRDADAVRIAAAGTLSIRNGPATRVIQLSPDQLREGRILYLPLSGVDVDVRLEVTTASGRTEAESVQLVSFNTAPGLPLPSLTAPQPPTRQANSRADRAEQRETVALQRAVKPFRTEALARPVMPTPPADISVPDTPPVGAPKTVDLNLAGMAAPPAPPPRVKQQPPPGGRIDEARLISGPAPEYPRQAREARIAGTVELQVTIGADGTVKSARAIRGDPRLRQPALDAVKQWIYRPTMLNGKPVEAQRQIVLNFKP